MMEECKAEMMMMMDGGVRVSQPSTSSVLLTRDSRETLAEWSSALVAQLGKINTGHDRR